MDDFDAHKDFMDKYCDYAMILLAVVLAVYFGHLAWIWLWMTA